VAAGEIASEVCSDAPNYRVEAVTGAHISLTGDFRGLSPKVARGGTATLERGKEERTERTEGEEATREHRIFQVTTSTRGFGILPKLWKRQAPRLSRGRMW
jgi:hypothetical protein